MKTENLSERTNKRYDQYRKYLLQYSEFTFKENSNRTIYYKNPDNLPFLDKHKSEGLYLRDTSIQSVAKLCRIIRLFAVDRKVTIQNPFNYDGIQLIKMCLEGHKLNCAGCSVILNDILLTLGFKSKCICCIPFDTQDTDTHVLVHIYDENTKSWFVADPALGCVPCNGNGIGLDMLKLRKLLSLGEELYFYQSGMIVKDFKRRQNYAEILAKNMAMFVVFNSSGLYYQLEKSKMIVPSGITDISSLYIMCEKTNNSYYLYN